MEKKDKRSTSLNNYREKFQPQTMIRISERNLGEMDGLISLPLYMAVLL